MPADPVVAGRKGGSSRSAKKIAAARRNGFQRVYPRKEETEKSERKTTADNPPVVKCGTFARGTNPLFEEQK